MVAFYGLGKRERRYRAAARARSSSRNMPHACAHFDPDTRQQAARRTRPDRATTARASACCRTGGAPSITVETAGESTLDTDVLELVHRSLAAMSGWRSSPAPRSATSSAAARMSGSIMMSIWYGHRQRRCRPPTCPRTTLAPTRRRPAAMAALGHVLSFRRTGGRGARSARGRAACVDLLQPVGRQLRRREEREDIWHQMLSLYTQQVFSIGLINGTLQPILRSAKHAERAGARALRLRSDLLSSASTCRTPSGSREA